METGHALSHDDSVLQADTGTGDTLALSVTKLSSLLLTAQRQKEPLNKRRSVSSFSVLVNCGMKVWFQALFSTLASVVIS